MMQTCKNCGHHFEGNYCNNCGSPAHVHKVNTSFIIHDLQHGLFHFDGGILFTIRQLLIRPGHTVRDFLEGNRSKHYKPISMVIVLASLYGLLYHYFEINVFRNQNNNELDYNSINEWIFHHFSITTLLMIPILSLGSFIVFRKQHYNFTEHIILNTFYSSLKLCLRIVTIPIIIWTENPNTVMQLLVVVDFFLMLWCYVQFFENQSRWETAFLTFLANIFDLTLISVITTIIFYIIFLQNVSSLFISFYENTSAIQIIRAQQQL